MRTRDLLALGMVAAAVAIGTGACGGGGSGGSGGGAGSSGTKSPSTIAIKGVPSSKKLSELTKDEAIQVCKAISDAVEHALSDADAARLTCTLFAALTSGTPGAGNTINVNATACAKSVNDCVAQASGTTTTQSSCDPATAMSCDATVAQLQTCLNATVAQIQEVFHMFTCEKLAASGVPQNMLSSAQGSASVPQCADLQARCPNLKLGGNSSSSSVSSGPSGKPAANGCDDTCFFSDDGQCDDGGPGSFSGLCALGTDCKDCGKR